MAIEPTSFECLEAATRPKVLRYLSRFVGPTEAEDLAQEVFLKVHQGLSRFRGEAKLSTWVFQVATHAALDRLKSPSYRASRALLPEAMLEGADIHAGPDHGQEPMKAEMCHCIRDLVDDLPLNDRTIIYLSELKELRIGAVAEILGISAGSAKIRLHRARRRLRAQMEQDCRILLDEQAELQCDRKEAP
ncbi:RNA polymerase sigma factor [Geothrix limicola]|uniref:RNA polymerase sigma factor n=1 Tax=Geothrix limicola TaxID=2927978 RepID=A0ABQ5QCT4_9BACT|nr:RNA polymerase sigma factor [Geothrix limicola]GLH72654.1 RNA polymerase sigma factor [Geothrix limicola]